MEHEPWLGSMNFVRVERSGTARCSAARGYMYQTRAAYGVVSYSALMLACCVML
jgi:hypothetical protein